MSQEVESSWMNLSVAEDRLWLEFFSYLSQLSFSYLSHYQSGFSYLWPKESWLMHHSKEAVLFPWWQIAQVKCLEKVNSQSLGKVNSLSWIWPYILYPNLEGGKKGHSFWEGNFFYNQINDELQLWVSASIALIYWGLTSFQNASNYDPFCESCES